MSVLACDVGGTQIKVGLVDQGQLLDQMILAAHSDQGLLQALPRIATALRQLCNAQTLDPSECQGLGMGFPALINSREGRILDEYGKYQDAPSLDLPTWAQHEFALPLAIDNDARVALLGEWTCGAGQDSQNLAIITLGTGIGTAVVCEGRLLRGAHFQAGNLGGHFTVIPNGRPCFCGGRGCVEAETGSAHLQEQAESMPGFYTSTLAASGRLDYQIVCNHAKAGDAVAVALLERATTLWGILCVDLVHAYDLDRIVIGGGLMASAPLLLPLMQRYVDTHAHTPWGRVSLVAAQYPAHMGLLGCEPLVNQQLHLDP